MDTFLVGFLSAVVIIFLIAVVVGMVLIVKSRKRIRNLEENLFNTHEDTLKMFENAYRDSNERFNEVYANIKETGELLEKEMESNLDSRINKLENKIKQ